MKTKKQINILKGVILKNKNGFSCDFRGRLINKNKGFFVAITDIKGKNLNYLIKKVLYIKRMGFKDNKNLIVGGWKDKEGFFYLDLSLYLENLNLSKKIGSLFNQKAIFNINKMEDIYLN